MDKNRTNDGARYQRLLGVLKGFLREARSLNAGVPRAHMLRCVECQAREKWDASQRVVVDGAGDVLDADEFIIVSIECEPYWRDAAVRMKTSYESICPDCGVWLKESFDESLDI